MEGVRRVLLGTGLLLCFIHAESAMQCSRENFWGVTERFYCPEDDDLSKEFCCGFGDDKYCCSTFIDDDFIENLPTILGVIAVIILGFVGLCVLCCCLCPFCLLYKRRHQGTVHNPNRDAGVMQPLQNQPVSHAPPPQNAPYPTQPAYAPQPAPYPAQPGYPPQPYPAQPYQPQPYPPQGYPADPPPMYSEKQPPAYNPSY